MRVCHAFIKWYIQRIVHYILYFLAYYTDFVYWTGSTEPKRRLLFCSESKKSSCCWLSRHRTKNWRRWEPILSSQFTLPARCTSDLEVWFSIFKNIWLNLPCLFGGIILTPWFNIFNASVLCMKKMSNADQNREFSSSWHILVLMKSV